MRAAAGLAAALAVPLLLLLTVSPSRAMTKSRAKITDISPNEGSLAGGTLVTISGAGFERGGIEGITTIYIGSEICKTIEYYSSDTQIVCRTPPSQAQLTLDVHVHLISIDAAQTAVCETYCAFRYTSSSTPYISRTTQALAPGDMLNVFGYLRGQHAGNYEILFGNRDAHCEILIDSDDRVLDAWNKEGSIECRMPEIPAHRYNYTLRVDHDDAVGLDFGNNDGRGNAIPQRSTWQAENNVTYLMTVYPKIASLSTNMSGALGGATLRIDGRGFDAEDDCVHNSVKVGGADCEITACAPTYLECTLPSQPNAAAGTYAAPRGMRLARFDVFGSGTADSYTRTPSAVTVETASLGNGFEGQVIDDVGSELTGVLVAPVSGHYQFYMRVDDKGSLELGDTASPVNLTTMITISAFSSSFYTRSGQISAYVHLNAGERRFLRVRHEEDHGGQFYYVALRILPDAGGDALTHDERLHNSPRERQIVSFSSDVVREQQRITLTRVGNGSFSLAYGSEFTDFMPWDAPTSTMESALRDLSLLPCNDFDVDDEAASAPATRVLTVTFKCATAMPYRMLALQQSFTNPLRPADGSSGPINFVVERTRHASEPIRGVYRLGLDGAWTEPLSYSAGASDISRALYAATALSDVEINTWGSSSDGLNFRVNVYLPTGNISSLDVNVTELTGPNVRASVSVEDHGGHEFFYNPIPMDFVERWQPADAPPLVAVTTNGIRATCEAPGIGSDEAPGACHVEYSEARTPSITALAVPSPATVGDTLEISGTGFDAAGAANATDAVVTVDGAACRITAATASSIVCTLGHATAGDHAVVVVVPHAGLARDQTGGQVLTYDFVLDATSPDTGSVAGGSRLVIEGTGFAPTDVVVVDGAVCPDAADAPRTRSRITCIVPASATELTAAAGGAGPATGTLIAAIDVGVHTAVATFTYDWALTPRVSSVSPATWPSAITTAITLPGDFAGAVTALHPYGGVGAGVNGTSLCGPQASPIEVTFGSRPCANARLDEADDAVYCTVFRGDGLAAASQQGQTPTITFCDATHGLLRAHVVDAATADIAHRVATVSPSQGSLAGGTVVTITGAGFGSKLDLVGVRAKNDNSSIACQVTNVTETQVLCTMDASDEPVLGGAVELQIQGFVARCASEAACAYSLTIDATPTVTALELPVSGIRAHSLIGVAGTLFTSLPSVWLGDRACVVTEHSSSGNFTFRVPPLAAGRYPLRVHVAPHGDAAHSELHVTYPLRFYGVLDHEGSAGGGGLFTVEGDGFSSHALNNYVVVGDHAAVVVSAAANHSSVTVAAPAHAADEGTPKPSSNNTGEITIHLPTALNLGEAHAATMVGTAECTGNVGRGNPLPCEYIYRASLTPEVTSLTPVSGKVGDRLDVIGSGFGTDENGLEVSIGGAACELVPNTLSDNGFGCTLGVTPAGAHSLIVDRLGHGVAMPLLFFTSALQLDSVAPTTVSFGGGNLISLAGLGLGSEPATAGSAAAKRTVVHVCGKPCHVQSAAYAAVTCRVPALNTPASLTEFNNVIPRALAGTPSGTSGSTNENVGTAFDDNFDTYSQSSWSNRFSCHIIYDLGERGQASLHRIRYYPRLKATNLVVGGIFSVSTDGASWATVATVGNAATSGWNVITLDEPTAFVRYVRYAGPSGSRCEVAELEYIGLPADSLDGDGDCPVQLGVAAPPAHRSRGRMDEHEHGVHTHADGTAIVNLPAVHVEAGIKLTYAVENTAAIVAVEPQMGPSLGGTLVRLSGSNLPTAIAGVTVLLNQVPCTVNETSGDGTWVRCITGVRSGSYVAPSIVLTASDGAVAVHHPSVRYRFLDRWSLMNTWRNDEPPIDGDTVIVPDNQVVLLDVQPPRLFLLMVQGELVFDRRDLDLTADYIWVNGGRLEIGTEEEPFEQKVTITLIGDFWHAIGIPHIGAKTLAVSNAGAASQHHAHGQGAAIDESDHGVLDIHGIPRLRVWTKVAATAAAGDSSIAVAEAVDYAAGETIIITSHTNYRQTEERTVAGLANGGRTILLETPLQHTHTSVIHEQDGQTVDMRVEVALLTRNIVIQGEPGTSARQLFGAHVIAVHGATMRLENAEIRHCGQAGRLGRYCSHFHMAGELETSYIRSNSIHHSFQRAVTVHGTHRSLVQNNVAYRVLGHTYFVEDGNERFNVIEANLAVFTEPLDIALKGDQKPASFWTASPVNFWRHNVAAGCSHDGYWFELPGHPHGPSFTTSICPVHEAMLEFLNNTAHANGVHGIRIYPTYLPYADPCDASSGPAPQRFYNFTSFYNGAHGIFGKTNGDLHHYNAKLVGNGGEELLWTKFPGALYRADDPNIKDALLIHNIDGPATGDGASAIMMPQHEFFHVENIQFVNYGATGALAGCADCSSDTSFRQGGYTFRMGGLTFTNSPRRIKWTTPYKQIFFDLDGSLTGHVNGTATPYRGYHVVPGVCERSDDTHDTGIVCDSTVRVRRLQIDDVEPKQLDFRPMHIAQSDAPEYNDTQGFRPKEFYGWAIPLVTNRAYDLGIVSLVDLRQLRIRYSEPEYITEAEHVQLTFNYTDYRYAFGVSSSVLLEDVPAVTTIDNLTATTPFGTGRIDHADKEWSVMLSTASELDAVAAYDRLHETAATARGPLSVDVKALQCAPGRCTGFFGDEPLYEPWMWNNLTNWCRDAASGKAIYGLWDELSPCEHAQSFPQPGDDVTINPRLYVVLNVPPPRLRHLQIVGKLQFLDTADRLLEADTIAVWGSLQIGSPAIPYTHEAVIRLHGERISPTLIVHNSRFLGNKVMAVLGEVALHGVTPEVSWTRLAMTAEAGATQLDLLEPVDWLVGDRVVLTATEYDAEEVETATIAAVSNNGYTVTVASGLQYRHFAGPVSTGRGDVMLRAAVGRLHRNVRFEGAQGAGEGENYGAHIVVMDVTFDEGVKVGSARLSGVELAHCGQQNMEHACVFYKYDRQYSEEDGIPFNELRSCVMSDSLNYGLAAEGVPSLVVEDTVVHRAYRSAIEVDSRSKGIVLRRNLVAGNYRSPDEGVDWIRPFAAFFIEATDFKLEGNVAGGAQDAGFVVSADRCDAPTGNFISNEAHGCLIGVMILPETSGNECLLLRDFVAWKIAHIAVATTDQRGSLKIQDVTVADSHIGFAIDFFSVSKGSEVEISSTNIIGSSDASRCDASIECRAVTSADVTGQGDTCTSVFGSGYRRVGVILPQYTNRGKTCRVDGGLARCRPTLTPERLCSMGWEKRYGLPSTQYARLRMVDVAFAHWNASDCGRTSTAIAVNPMQRNYSPEQEYQGIIWHEADLQARAWFTLNALTAGECGMACDSLNFLLARDLDGSFAGGSAGDVITSAANPGLIDGGERCTPMPHMGAHRCHSMPLRAGSLESKDRDRGFRRLGPVKIVRLNETGDPERATQSVGPYSDNCAKRFHFAQFPLLFEAGREYQLNTSGTFPNTARIHFESTDPNEAVLLRMHMFIDSRDLRVANGGSTRAPLSRVPTMSDARASNIYDGRGTFYLLLRGSEIAAERIYDIRVINRVKLNMTFSVSMEEFFGPRLIENLATLLDIPESRIKIVDVHPVTVSSAKASAPPIKTPSAALADLELGINGGTAATGDEESTSARRRSMDGVTASVEILSSGSATIPTTDEAIDEETKFFNEVLTSMVGLADSGALASSLGAAGMPLEVMAVSAPASYGVGSGAFSLAVSSSSSSGPEAAVIGGAVAGAAIVVLVVVLLLYVKHRKTKRERLSKTMVRRVSVGLIEGTNTRSSAGAMATAEMGLERKPSRREQALQLAQMPSRSPLVSEGISLEVPAVQRTKSKDSLLDRLRKKRSGIVTPSPPGTPGPGGSAAGFSSSPPPYETDLKNVQHAPTVQERKEMLASMEFRVVSRRDWEYVRHYDWYDPHLSRDKAHSIIKDKSMGTFLVYGRKDVFLCVKSAKAVVRHDRLVFEEGRGFRVELPNQPWHEDLASLVAYMQQARPNVPYVLKYDEENDVHFSVPSARTNRLTGEEYGVEQPRYTEQDLHRLSRRVSRRLSKSKLPPSAMEMVSVDAGSSARPVSLRTAEDLATFEPLILRDSDAAAARRGTPPPAYTAANGGGGARNGGAGGASSASPLNHRRETGGW